MCRNIKQLFNFEPLATQEEIRASSLQFVRKISGSVNPSKQNKEAFNLAIEEVEQTVQKLLNSLTTKSLPKNREEEALKAKLRNKKRFG